MTSVSYIELQHAEACINRAIEHDREHVRFFSEAELSILNALAREVNFIGQRFKDQDNTPLAKALDVCSRADGNIIYLSCFRG